MIFILEGFAYNTPASFYFFYVTSFCVSSYFIVINDRALISNITYSYSSGIVSYIYPRLQDIVMKKYDLWTMRKLVF